MNAYQEKLNKLPANVRDYLDSVAGIDLNLRICDQNGLAGNDILRNTDLVVDLFFKELALKDLVAKIEEVFKYNDFKAKKLAADIAGIRLLVVDDVWFKGEVLAYLKSLGAPLADYQKIVEEQKAAVKKDKEEDAAEEAERRAKKAEIEAALSGKEETPVKKEEELKIPEDFKINWEEEAKNCLDNFREGLADFLSFDNYSDEYNQVLISLLVEKERQFQNELEKAILNNNEILTSASFSVDGKPVMPTISNWLKYFIKEKGSSLFDNIILTNFLTDSQNCRVLSEEEKKTVKRLLLLYRNFKFFPDSMPNQTGEGWEIIPSEGEVSGSGKARTVSTPQTGDFFAKAKAAAAGSAISEEDRKKIDDLKKMALNYKTGSLERMAVDEEIKKIESKK
jgi:hypothetical protein